MTSRKLLIECPAHAVHRLPTVVTQHVSVVSTARPVDDTVWVYRLEASLDRGEQFPVPLDLLGWAHEHKCARMQVPGWGWLCRGLTSSAVKGHPVKGHPVKGHPVQFELAPWMQHGNETNPVNFVILGCGQRGVGYVRILSRLQYGTQPVTLGGLYDVVSAKSTFLAETCQELGFQPQVFATEDEVQTYLSDNPATIPLICTPDEQHLANLERFAHCVESFVLEKPAVQNAAELLTLRRWLQRVTVHVPYVLRFCRLWRAAQVMISDRPRPQMVHLVLRLTPEHTASFVRRAPPAGALTRFIRTKLCHDIDLLMWLFGSAMGPHPTVSYGTGMMKNAELPAQAPASCQDCVVRGCWYRHQGRYGVQDRCVVGEEFYDYLWISGTLQNGLPYSLQVDFHCTDAGRELRVLEADGTTLCVNSFRNTVCEDDMVVAVGGDKAFHNGGDLQFVHQVMQGDTCSHTYLRASVLWADYVARKVNEELSW